MKRSVKKFIENNIQSIVSGGVICALFSLTAVIAALFNDIAPGAVVGF